MTEQEIIKDIIGKITTEDLQVVSLPTIKDIDLPFVGWKEISEVAIKGANAILNREKSLRLNIYASNIDEALSVKADLISEIGYLVTSNYSIEYENVSEMSITDSKTIISMYFNIIY